MGTGSFLGVKRPGHGVDHPSASSAKVKERVEIYLYSPSGPITWIAAISILYIFSISVSTFLLYTDRVHFK